MIYLDNAATTPVRREAIEAMWPYLTGEFGNPSSTHALGETAAHALESARKTVAGFLGVRASTVTFTSGGTEANNLAIKGIALASPRGRHIVTTAIEHEAILESIDYLVRFHGFEVSFVPLTGEGLVTVEALAGVVRADTTLVTIHHANNEIGVVQPIAQLAASVAVPFHTDAVQAAGWLPMPKVDAVTIAGHKLGAPKGIGVLATALPLEPLLHGGGQERGRRSGTENVAGAVALAAVVGISHADVAGVRDALIDGVLGSVASAVLTGPRWNRLPGHASFCFPGTSGEAVLLELERHGIVCSSGSACAAGHDDPSHVLVALGIDPVVAQTAVRFTLGDGTTLDEALETVDRVTEAVAMLSSLR